MEIIHFTDDSSGQDKCVQKHNEYAINSNIFTVLVSCQCIIYVFAHIHVTCLSYGMTDSLKAECGNSQVGLWNAALCFILVLKFCQISTLNLKVAGTTSRHHQEAPPGGTTS